MYSLAKYTEGSRELTEDEFAAGIEAAQLLRDVFKRELTALECGSTRSSQSGMGGGARSDSSEGMEGGRLRRPSSGHAQVKSYTEERSSSGASLDIALS